MSQAQFQTIILARSPINDAANPDENACDSEADDYRHKHHHVFELIHYRRPLSNLAFEELGLIDKNWHIFADVAFGFTSGRLDRV